MSEKSVVLSSNCSLFRIFGRLYFDSDLILEFLDLREKVAACGSSSISSSDANKVTCEFTPSSLSDIKMNFLGRFFLINL